MAITTCWPVGLAVEVTDADTFGVEVVGLGVDDAIVVVDEAEVDDGLTDASGVEDSEGPGLADRLVGGGAEIALPGVGWNSTST